MKIENVTEQHHYPQFVKRFPRLIYFHYFFLKLLFLRSRICQRRLIELIRNQPSVNFQILDAGCGEGQYLVPLAHKFQNHNFVGLDQDPGHIGFLRKLAKKEILKNCTFLQNTITSHFNNSVSYDLIYIIGVLQYISEPGKSIKSFSHSLKPAGKLMIYTPVKTNLHFKFYNWIRKKFGHYDDAQPIYQPIDEQQLFEWIKSAGLRITRKEYYYGNLGTLGHEIFQSLVMLMTHLPWLLKIIPGLLFLLLFPIFVSLQIADSIIQSRNQQKGNGLLLILQKYSARGQEKEEENTSDDTVQSDQIQISGCYSSFSCG